jgi:hypothetical protein
MIKYLVSSLNSDLSTPALMREASRCLFMSVNPDSTQEYAQYDMFQTSEINSVGVMIVDTSESIQINNRSHLSDFLNMFSISDQEKTNILTPINTGDKVSFQSISPSNLVDSTYEDLIAMKIIQEDNVE